MPEFCFNWTSVPRLQPLGRTTIATAAPAPAPIPAQQPQPVTQSPPDASSSSSSPHSLPNLSTSGTRPKTSQPTTPAPSKPDPSGASTSGTTPPAENTSSRNLRQRMKVDYKDLHTGALLFGHKQCQKWCSRAGASVQKSVTKVRKMSLAELFLPISRNSSSSSTASSKWARANHFRTQTWNWSMYEEHVLFVSSQFYYWIYKCTTCHHYTNIIKTI